MSCLLLLLCCSCCCVCLFVGCCLNLHRCFRGAICTCVHVHCVSFLAMFLFRLVDFMCAFMLVLAMRFNLSVLQTALSFSFSFPIGHCMCICVNSVAQLDAFIPMALRLKIASCRARRAMPCPSSPLPGFSKWPETYSQKSRYLIRPDYSPRFGTALTLNCQTSSQPKLP